MRRFLLLVFACSFLAAVPMQAWGHEQRTALSSYSAFFQSESTESITDATRLADPQPLTGTGSNMRIVANVPMEGSVAASDLELAGDYAYVGSYGEGMVIVDIKDPRNPKRAGVFNCPGGQNDIQLQPGSNPQYAVMAIESTSNKCHPNNEGFVVIDISDKASPKEVAFIGQSVAEGGVQDGAHNTTMDWPWLYVDQYQPTHGQQEGRNGQYDIFDLREVIKGSKARAAVLEAEGGGAHDLQVDHRPDGKTLAYAASIGFTDVLDVTDPTKPAFVQRLSAAEHGVGISHGAEPNFDRTLMIESDEYGGGSGVVACGGGSDARVPANVSGTANIVSPGAVHFLKLDPDGKIKTFGDGKVDQAGAFNLTPQNNDNANDGCTSHVFWQAPNENRMVIAWYGRGTRIVDFSNPGAPVEIGHFIPTDAETWSAKPHKGYIFAGDTVRGLDVLEYTGEDCARWPTIAGAAEVQRARYQGTTAPADAPAFVPAGCGDAATTDPVRDVAVPAQAATPAQTAPPAQPRQQPRSTATKRVGGYRFVRAARVPKSRARTRTVFLQVVTAKGKVVATKRYRVRSGRLVRLRAAIAGPTGRYRYRIVAGRKILRSGSFTVKTISKIRVSGATADRLRLAALRR
jgi:hypothetical protein